jgi:hypothetical protein
MISDTAFKWRHFEGHIIPNGLANLERLRDNADDPEGISFSRWSPGPSQVRRQPVWTGCLTLLNPRLTQPLCQAGQVFATEPVELLTVFNLPVEVSEPGC